MMVIYLELILLSVGLLLVNLSFHLDDILGSTMTLYILPLAGAESAVALALLVAFYPLRGTILSLVNCMDTNRHKTMKYSTLFTALPVECRGSVND